MLVELRKLSLAFALERARLIVLFVIVVAVTAVAYLLWPRQYLADTYVMPATGEPAAGLAGIAGRISALGLDLGSAGSEGPAKSEALALLVSRTVVEPFMVAEGVLDAIFPEGYRMDRSSGDSRLPTVADGYEVFTEEILRVEEDIRTGLVIVSVKWRDPVLAAKWSIALVERVNQTMRQRAIEEATRNLEFLNTEFSAATTVSVQQAISGLVERELRAKMLANVRPDYALRFVERALPPDVMHYSSPNLSVTILVSFLIFSFVSSLIVWVRLATIERAYFMSEPAQDS